MKNVGGVITRTGNERGRAMIEPKRVEIPTHKTPGTRGSVSFGGARDLRRATENSNYLRMKITRTRPTFDGLFDAYPTIYNHLEMRTADEIGISDPFP